MIWMCSILPFVCFCVVLFSGSPAFLLRSLSPMVLMLLFYVPFFFCFYYFFALTITLHTKAWLLFPLSGSVCECVCVCWAEYMFACIRTPERLSALLYGYVNERISCRCDTFLFYFILFIALFFSNSRLAATFIFQLPFNMRAHFYISIVLFVYFFCSVARFIRVLILPLHWSPVHIH